MTIFCHTPNHGFSRIYISADTLESAKATPQDDVWAQIKTHKFSIEPGEEQYFWVDDEDENEERSRWFADWDNDAHWSFQGPIAVDTMY